MNSQRSNFFRHTFPFTLCELTSVFFFFSFILFSFLSSFSFRSGRFHFLAAKESDLLQWEKILTPAPVSTFLRTQRSPTSSPQAQRFKLGQVRLFRYDSTPEVKSKSPRSPALRSMTNAATSSPRFKSSDNFSVTGGLSQSPQLANHSVHPKSFSPLSNSDFSANFQAVYSKTQNNLKLTSLPSPVTETLSSRPVSLIFSSLPEFIEPPVADSSVVMIPFEELEITSELAFTTDCYGEARKGSWKGIYCH